MYLVAAFFIWFLSFGFYCVTLAPAVIWGDPAKLVNFAYLCLLRIDIGNHALHNLIGNLWGRLLFADYAFGQNLLSAVFASLTVFMVFLIVYRLTKSIFSSIVSSLSLAVAHTFWWLAVVNESYALVFFFLVLALLGEIVWFQTKKQGWLYLAAFSIGMGISDHFMLAVLIPAFIIAALIDDPWLILDYKKILFSLSSFILGAGLLLYLYISNYSQYSSITWAYFVDTTYLESMGKIVRELIRYPLYVFYQFPLIGFVLGIIGLWQSFKNKAGICCLLFLAFLVDYLFSAVYMWERQPEMMVFGYIIIAIWIGLGINYLAKKNPPLVSRSGPILLLGIIFVPIMLYSCAPYFAQKAGGNVLHIRSLPYRNNDEYFLNPNKRGYFGARRYAEEVYRIVEPDSMIIADFTPYAVLQYLQLVEKKRQDVELVYTWPGARNPIGKGIVEQNIRKRPIYLVDIDDYPDLYKTPVLSKKYSFVKTGPIYRLVKKK